MNTLINTFLNGPTDYRARFITTCEPVTVSMGVMAAAGAAASIQGQRQAQKMAKGTEEARRLEQENVITENRRRSTDDYLNQTRLTMEQQAQEEASVAVKSGDVMRETRRSVATGTASAAERGVAGRTIEQIASDYDFQANEETGRLKQNQALANQQHQESLRGLKTQFNNRITDVKPYIPKQQAPVDYAGPLLGAAGTMLNFGVKTDSFKSLMVKTPAAPAPKYDVGDSMGNMKQFSQ